MGIQSWVEDWRLKITRTFWLEATDKPNKKTCQWLQSTSLPITVADASLKSLPRWNHSPTQLIAIVHLHTSGQVSFKMRGPRWCLSSNCRCHCNNPFASEIRVPGYWLRQCRCPASHVGMPLGGVDSQDSFCFRWMKNPIFGTHELHPWPSLTFSSSWITATKAIELTAWPDGTSL